MVSWRYIPFRYYDPYVKTGLNQAAIESVQAGNPPIIWLAGWEQDCVNVGYGQTISDEIDRDAAAEHDTCIVRRQGGGGTTYLTRDGEITWGIIAPTSFFPDSLDTIYSQTCGQIADTLEAIGIQAEHEPVNDIVTSNGKISGATCKKTDGAVYVGGTLLYDVDIETMFTILTPSSSKLQDKDIDDFRERVTTVRAETDASFDDTVETLANGLLKDREHRKTDWTAREMDRAQELAEIYRSDRWLFRND